MIPSNPQRIYLASRSPRRRELLTQIGVRFELLLFRGQLREDADTDEIPLPQEMPEDYVKRVTLAKARAGMLRIKLRQLIQQPLLAADTTVEVDGCIIGKPANTNDAVEILRCLSGRTHRVLTAVAVAEEDRIEQALNISEVRFRPLEIDEIKRYVASGEAFDKAGAYGIQGRAAIFVEEIRGSHSGIMGLPLCETTMLLRRFGYPI
jgi:septum formation protein